MFWADSVTEELIGKQLVNDSWTPSGIVHMGSLKGPVIHDVLYKILREKGCNVKFQYGFDDADPIDGLPPELQKSHAQYLGVPINIAPSPDGNGTFGDYYSGKMKRLLDELRIKTEIYKTSELYKKGFFNKAIVFILDNAEKVRKVYGEIYKKEIPNTWYPLQVICPKCGKLGTTKVTAWDGKEVTFVCSPDLVKWAQGCGTTGKMSPLDGNGKMPWKVEWAAKWWTFGVTVEAAGKDHASAGGSYDVAMKICKDVFEKEPPLKIAYEFFLVDGKKMSSSKGLGLNGEDLLGILAPEVARFLMIKTPPNRAVEFSPKDTLIIPKLYDDYMDAATELTTNQDTEAARACELSIVDPSVSYPPVRFLTLAQWVQMPNMESTIKKEGLDGWAKYARVWIEKFAPESEKFVVSKELPEAAHKLSDQQKRYLKLVAERFDKCISEVELSKELYTWGQETMITSKDIFAAIYLALLGKDHGPKAASLIRSLDKEFVKKRFEEVASSSLRDHAMAKQSPSKDEIDTSQTPRNDRWNKPEIFSIDTQVGEKFPTISIGIAVIKGVTIEKSNNQLEKEKQTLLTSLESLTTEDINQFTEVVSYRKLYKEMGVDWHSRRPSPEALLRRVALKKGLYTINTCVDAYNLVVMKHKISIGAFDLDQIVLPTSLRMAKEGEEILLLGDTEPTKYKPTELAYFDAKGGYNIDFNFRDAQRTAVTESTKNLYINVDGIYDITPQQVEQSLKEACDMIIKYCGGKLELFGVETS